MKSVINKKKKREKTTTDPEARTASGNESKHHIQDILILDYRDHVLDIAIIALSNGDGG